MARRWERWQTLPSKERNLLMAMLLALPAVSASLRIFGFARTRGWMERTSRTDTRRHAMQSEVADAERLAVLAAIAGRHGPIRATCLRQSLLVFWMLRRRRLAPELKLGARRTGSLPDMHAWVELDGTPLGQDRLTHVAFAPLQATPETQPPACRHPS